MIFGFLINVVRERVIFRLLERLWIKKIVRCYAASANRE